MEAKNITFKKQDIALIRNGETITPSFPNRKERRKADREAKNKNNDKTDNAIEPASGL